MPRPALAPSTVPSLSIFQPCSHTLTPPPRRDPFPFLEGPVPSVGSQPACNDSSSRKAACLSATLSPAPDCGLPDLGVNTSSATQQVHDHTLREHSKPWFPHL